MAAIPTATVTAPSVATDVTTPATAATSTMTFLNDGVSCIHISTGATTANLTISTYAKFQDGSPSGLSVSNPVIALAANKRYVVGPFPPSIYNDPSGFVNLAFSATTSITVQAYNASARVN